MAVQEYCDAKGAVAIADTVKAFWKAKGFEVKTWVEPVQLAFRGNKEVMTIICVRSDMINGLPKDWN